MHKPVTSPRRHRRGTSLVVALAALCFIGASGCKRRAQTPDPGIPYATTSTSPKLSTFVFKEEGKLYMVTVGVNATRFHDKDAFIPLTVLLANKNAPTMMITRESFTLVEPVTGGRYGLASVEEIRRQGKQSFDRQLMDLDHIPTKLEAFRQVPASFFPSQGILNDDLELHSFQYFVDNLYFPRPEGDLLGKTFELHVSARGMEAPLLVVFTVPEA